MTLFSCSPAVAEIAMMKRSPGKAITISLRRETTVSTAPRKYPARAPSRTPSPTENTVANTATSSEVRAPYSRRRNRSRPIVLSAPRMNSVVPPSGVCTRVIGPTGRYVSGSTAVKNWSFGP